MLYNRTVVKSMEGTISKRILIFMNLPEESEFRQGTSETHTEFSKCREGASTFQVA